MSAPTITAPATASGGIPVGGSGAAGYVAKWTAATTLGGSTTTGATASLYVDATGQVGIGTASPTARLTVLSQGLGTAPPVWTPSLHATAVSFGAWDGSPAGGGVIASVLATARAGLVLGTNYSGGGISGAGAVRFVHGRRSQTDLEASTVAAVSADTTTGDATSGGLLAFSTRNTGGATLDERMRIDSSGNVGIGTASPIGTLDVRAANPTMVCSNSATRYGYSVWNDASSEFRTGTGGAHAFILLTSNTERMRIDSSGNVGIGTTSPTGRLHVVGGTAAAATNGAPVTIIAQSAGTGNQNGGNIVLTPGALSGSGSAGVADLSGPTGTGLKLPATPGNADSQTLDCYAEGTWTPTLSAAASWGGAQPTLSAARYVRIGSTVHCTVVLIGAPNFTSTYLATTITAPFSATYNAAVSISIGAPASGCAQHNAGGTTLFLPTFGFVQSATFSWTFIV